MTEHDFDNFFLLVRAILQKMYDWMTSITIGPLSLWGWIIGLWCASLVFVAIRFFSGLSGPGLSHGVTSVVEAGRYHKEGKEDK